MVAASGLGPTPTLAEMALTVFATTILEDDELMLDETDEIDVHRLRERFPGLMSLHQTVLKANGGGPVNLRKRRVEA